MCIHIIKCVYMKQCFSGGTGFKDPLLSLKEIQCFGYLNIQYIHMK